ncbi:hypothetical protein Tco_0900903 [Tanacetum coccineum]
MKIMIHEIQQIKLINMLKDCQPKIDQDTYTPEPLTQRSNVIYYGDDDDEESTSQLPPFIAITTSLPVLSTGLVPIPSESEDTFGNDNECDLPFCDDSPPLDVLEGNFVTFSNPLSDSNDDFTSSNDESLPEEDLNEDECFNPGGGEIDVDIPSDFEDDYYNSKGDIIYLESLLINDTIPNLPPEVFLDHDPKSLNDEPNIDDLKIKENVRFTFEDRHYLSLTFVIKIFLPFLTYLVNSPLFLSSRSENTIFDPGISAYSFYSLEPVASHRNGTFMCFNVYPNILNESPIEIFSSTCFNPMDH